MRRSDMTRQTAEQGAGSELSDMEAIVAVRAGDRGSFAVLVKRHNQTMFRACRAVLRSDADAEDAVQAAWINIYRALAGFRGEASFRSWATRVAVNEATSRLRRHRRFAEVPLEETTMDDSEGPDHAAFNQQLSRLLEREIDELPEAMRAVLVLRDVIELDTAETAECLGIEAENVRVRLHRARQALAQRIADSASEATGASLAEVWRFDGERCARVLARVMSRIRDSDL